MTDEARFFLCHLFDVSSSSDSKPWTEIAARTIDLLQHRTFCLLDPLASPLVRLRVSPFELVFNLSLREMKFSGDVYGPGEVAFRRAGQRVASLDFRRGPEARLIMYFPPGNEPHEAHRRAMQRELELRIVDALKVRARKLGSSWR